MQIKKSVDKSDNTRYYTTIINFFKKNMKKSQKKYSFGSYNNPETRTITLIYEDNNNIHELELRETEISVKKVYDFFKKLGIKYNEVCVQVSIARTDYYNKILNTFYSTDGYISEKKFWQKISKNKIL